MSVIVPTLDEAAELPALLDHLIDYDDVIIVDGGSTDATCALAGAHPLAPRLLRVEHGRAAQLNAGAAVACGEVLLFLHADTRLPRHAVAAIEQAVANPTVVGGNFRLRFGGDDRFSSLLARWYAIERRLGVYYGDSAVWCRRSVFDALGGFRELPIMDDYDFVRRLERAGSTVCLPGPAVTSSRRWRRHGMARTVAAWTAVRWLYLAGVPAAWLTRLYPSARQENANV
ncbi:TIGR04283 family arsenosugar biosynthesis glycosyltransferase [Conexibacter sp. DBS9H8]|uniref:TIGR04283 family arsenosugar biosynthesis glycosyltransferase n=1 Tax=Conexibacter sp. DBS9H8 TaxID=2937801 RepID=UPI00200FE53D|nr:TIGR04283 family arsenosugar biosynthesis glycosyltransferase [Conexibacter sp. DBS9H8]